MKKLTLIRHAKSDWNNPELADFERPLNKRGKKDAPEMGKRLSKKKEIPQLIKLSTAERTRETIKLLKASAGWDHVKTVEKDWLYLASPQEYIKSIEKLDDKNNHVCYCGHNPTITSIINYYTGENFSDMPTCGVAILEFQVDKWEHVSKNSAKLSFYDFPKNF